MDEGTQLEADLADLRQNPLDCWLIYPPNSNKCEYLHGLFIGPVGTRYESQVFLVKIVIGGNYPFFKPNCEFITPIHCPFVRPERKWPSSTLSDPKSAINTLYFPYLQPNIHYSDPIKACLCLITEQLLDGCKEIGGKNLRRLQANLKEIEENPVENCTFRPRTEGDTMHFLATISGPPGSAYEKGTFTVEIDLSPNYPFSAPICRFITPIFHPNITTHGTFCTMHPIMAWRASNTLRDVLESLVDRLANPIVDCYQHDDYCGRGNKELQAARAREWTRLYAKSVV